MEILQPIKFIGDDWNNIRFYTITLLGNDLNIISHVITGKTKTLNGQQVYIHSLISIDKTSAMFVKVLHSTILS